MAAICVCYHRFAANGYFSIGPAGLRQQLHAVTASRLENPSRRFPSGYVVLRFFNPGCAAVPRPWALECNRVAVIWRGLRPVNVGPVPIGQPSKCPFCTPITKPNACRNHPGPAAGTSCAKRDWADSGRSSFSSADELYLCLCVCAVIWNTTNRH